MLNRSGCGRAGLMLAVAASSLAAYSIARAETLNEALAAAYHYNPRLDAQRAALRATDESVAIAMSGYRPRIDTQYDVNYQHVNLRPDIPTEGTVHPQNFQVSAEQSLFDGFKTRNAVAGSEADVRAGREQLRAVEQSTLLDAATAYMDIVLNQEVVRLRESNVGFLSTELKATQDRFAVGEVTSEFGFCGLINLRM